MLLASVKPFPPAITTSFTFPVSPPRLGTLTRSQSSLFLLRISFASRTPVDVSGRTPLLSFLRWHFPLPLLQSLTRPEWLVSLVSPGQCAHPALEVWPIPHPPPLKLAPPLFVAATNVMLCCSRSFTASPPFFSPPNLDSLGTRRAGTLKAALSVSAPFFFSLFHLIFCATFPSSSVLHRVSSKAEYPGPGLGFFLSRSQPPLTPSDCSRAEGGSIDNPDERRNYLFAPRFFFSYCLRSVDQCSFQDFFVATVGFSKTPGFISLVFSAFPHHFS